MTRYATNQTCIESAQAIHLMGFDSFCVLRYLNPKRIVLNLEHLQFRKGIVLGTLEVLKGY